MTFVVGVESLHQVQTDGLRGSVSGGLLLRRPEHVGHPPRRVHRLRTLRTVECPVDAIFSEDELPEDQQDFLDINTRLAEMWPNITEAKDPPPDADDWREVAEKRHLLEE